MWVKELFVEFHILLLRVSQISSRGLYGEGRRARILPTSGLIFLKINAFFVIRYLRGATSKVQGIQFSAEPSHAVACRRYVTYCR